MVSKTFSLPFMVLSILLVSVVSEDTTKETKATVNQIGGDSFPFPLPPGLQLPPGFQLPPGLQLPPGFNLGNIFPLPGTLSPVPVVVNPVPIVSPTPVIVSPGTVNPTPIVVSPGTVSPTIVCRSVYCQASQCFCLTRKTNMAVKGAKP